MIGFGSLGTALATAADTSAAAPSTAARPLTGDDLPLSPPEEPFWDSRPDQFLTVGWLHTFRHGLTGYGNGLELTYTQYPFYESLVGAGAYAQLQSVGDERRIALSIGPQLNYALLGLELGYEYLSSGQGQAESHGVHLAPFVSLGFVSLGWQAVLPFARSGSGDRPRLQHAVALTVKLPLPIAWKLNFGHGRPLTREGKPQLASTTSNSDWQPVHTPPSLTPDDALGELWLRRALAEHASIATFAELTLELMAHGAPPELLHAAQRAQADELRHAIACFGVASALLERQVGPGDYPAATRRVPGRSKAELAVESLRDGVLGEGYAAELARASITRAAPELQPLFRVIAHEEAQHAELGFEVLRWCLKAGGAEVAAALSDALQELPSYWPEIDVLDAEAHGVLGAVEQAHLYLTARTYTEKRVQALLHGAARALS